MSMKGLMFQCKLDLPMTIFSNLKNPVYLKEVIPVQGVHLFFKNVRAQKFDFHS